MTRTIGSSIRALGSQRFIAVACLLAVAGCGDETPVDATTNLKNLAGEETSDVDITGAEQAPEGPQGVAGDLGDTVGLTGATPVDGTPAEETESTAPEAGGFTQYIAFGDSFTSGFGLSGAVGLSSKGNDCARDFNAAWPPLVNKKLAIANPLTFAACSAATTKDILGGGPLIPKYQPRAQIEELPPPEQLNSALITIQIGGNDIKYDESFAKCAQAAQATPSKSSSFPTSGGAPVPGAPECQELDWLINNTTQVVNASLGKLLEDTFKTIRDRAPKATIIAVGYPHLVDATSACDNTLIGGIFPAETRQRFNDVADLINLQIANAAANAGILSLTTEVVSAFAGHEACSKEEWISTFSIHPTAVGHEVYAQVVASGALAAPTRTATVDPGVEATTDSAPPSDDASEPGTPGEEDDDEPSPAGEPGESGVAAPEEGVTPEDTATAGTPPPADGEEEPPTADGDEEESE